jgi:hypothetical protein
LYPPEFSFVFSRPEFVPRVPKTRCVISSGYSDLSSLYTRAVFFFWVVPLFDKKGDRFVGSCWWKQWRLCDRIATVAFEAVSGSVWKFEHDGFWKIHWNSRKFGWNAVTQMEEQSIFWNLNFGRFYQIIDWIHQEITIFFRKSAWWFPDDFYMKRPIFLEKIGHWKEKLWKNDMISTKFTHTNSS